MCITYLITFGTAFSYLWIWLFLQTLASKLLLILAKCPLVCQRTGSTGITFGTQNTCSSYGLKIQDKYKTGPLYYLGNTFRHWKLCCFGGSFPPSPWKQSRHNGPLFLDTNLSTRRRLHFRHTKHPRWSGWFLYSTPPSKMPLGINLNNWQNWQIDIFTELESPNKMSQKRGKNY